MSWYDLYKNRHPPIEDDLASAPPSYRDVEPRKPGMKWRASQVSKMCPREEVLCTLHDVHRQDVIETPLKFIFAVGTGIHDAMQRDFFSDILVGGWRCKGCGKEYGSQEVLRGKPKQCDGRIWDEQTNQPVPCPNRNYYEDVVKNWHLPGFEYMELTIRTEEPYILESHPDGFMWRSDDDIPDEIDPRDSRIELIELKSCSDSVFFHGRDGSLPTRIEPLLEHKIQAMTYLKIMGMDVSRIIYINKSGYGVRSTIASHLVFFSQSFFDTHIEHPILQYEEAVEKEDPTIANRVCSRPKCKRANSCAVRDLCWNED